MILRAFVGLLLTAANLLALNEEDSSLVRIKFRAICIDGPIEGSGYIERNKFKPMELNSDMFSEVHSYIGTKPLRLVVLNATAEAPQPEVAVAQNQLIKTRAIIEAVSQEIASARKRLESIESDIRELGNRAPVSSNGEISRLQQQLDGLNQRQANLMQYEKQALSTIAQPAKLLNKTDQQTIKSPRSAPSPASASTHKTLAEINPDKDGRCLVLISRNDQGVKVRLLDDNNGAFPFGSLQFINLSGFDVDVNFGADHLPLKPNAKGVISLRETSVTYADGRVYLPEADGNRLCSTLRVFKDEKVRILYLILPRADGNTGIRLKAIEQREQPEDTEPSRDIKGFQK